MAFSSGRTSITITDITDRISEMDILSYYLNIKKVPCFIHSPLREDKKPSFGLYSIDGKRVYYTDLSTGDKGGLFDLLSRIWGTTFSQTLEKIEKDFSKFITNNNITATIPIYTIRHHNSNVDIQCKIRDWKDYDIEYWKSYGISLKWLKYAEVYPISHKIVIKDKERYVFNADKYAYAYVEHKENKVTLKIYQPFNKDGYKWATKTDKSIWSLWTKIPKTGNNLFIASSLKDCLNLWENTGIPAICLQGEGYLPKPQVMEELKRRYKNIIIFYDNDYTNPDNPGKKDSITIAKQYNLKRVEIPAEYEAKDPSDLFKKYGKVKYLEIINNLIKNILWKNGDQ